jgi:hypothetical protein
MSNDTDTTGDRPVPSGADVPPTPEQEKYAEEAAERSPDVSAAFTAAARTGAAVKGEGEIEPE